MARRKYVVALIAVATMLAACDKGPTSSFGFSLPSGDISEGRAAFVKYQCADCHSVVGIDDLRAGIDPVLTVPLGGKTSRIKTYGELVTSVINPSHEISKKLPVAEVSTKGRSKMPNYNYVMTVSELIDLIAFLQAQYELEPFVPTVYPPYGYPPVL